jgi:hypothetical protein
LLYTSAIYITPEISQNIETVLGLTMKDGIGLSAKGWEQFIGKLQKEHQALAELFHDTYLSNGSL